MVGFSPCVKENLYASSRAEDDPKVAVSSINTAQADTACVSSRAIHPQPWCGQHQASSDISSRNVYNYSNQEEKEKTPMCRIAELARFHKLKHEYKLMDESGPAHKKMFTVQLFLTAEEVFEGSGASIKKAQQAAAASALAGTSLAMPPEKKRKKDTSSPPVLLSHVARRLGLPEPIYRSHSQAKMPLSPITPRFSASNSSLACNGTQSFDCAGCFPQNSYAHIPSRMPRGALLGPLPPVNPLFMLPLTSRSGAVVPVSTTTGERICMVSVAIGPGLMCTGVGSTFSLAKAHAAAQCLSFLGPHIQALDAKLRMDEQKRKNAQQKSSLMQAESLVTVGTGTEDVSEQVETANGGNTLPKHKQKSVISQVHECALQMKLNVEFEVVKEVGPPHDRSYVVRCSLKNPKNEVVVETVGEGRKKKEATQSACANVLSRLRGIENSPLFIASSLYKLQKRVLNPSREPKRKTIIKDMKMDPTYGHQINPVSRLIQVLQARCEDEPQFELISEQGQSRYKEFTVQVSCGSRICSGSGPNKRLAKRAAAEAMLAEIGYVKPLPPPGKSLLKKKIESQLNIGIFDPNDLITPAVQSTAGCSSSTQSVQQASHASEEQSLQEALLALTVNDQNSQQTADVDATYTSLNDSECGEVSNNVPPSPGRRRVTFSNQVKACPPPDDSKYPEPELAPLKAEVLVEGRVKRIRRTKEAKRALSEDQKCEIREMARISIQALQGSDVITCGEGAPDSEVLQTLSARRRLDNMSETFKFTVQYTNFPKSPDESDPLYFALVSLGLERPIVCHGRGSTMEAAADNAAFNAISNLCTYEQPQA
ncbi:Double-stranded RNA-binding protein Staufen [Trichostrongylus colubriformis]|uniref:Double-stranded RNA-binding protein Staufen n=2 Tax=Trichostrongylus colubriformis TaxID=6319 RepID=A0AAN8FT56_TRICO